ncbi:MAG: phosphoribosylformylglycinamidine synthase, purS protein [Bdellovibrio sp.]|nr:MAG: phosphoribosylformylglycinamidine synthase, purS protein [Bdellovibrio sp.]
MKVGVRVMPKKDVLDSQGRAVEKTLKHHGKQLLGCRVGKFIELEIDAKDKEEALRKAQEITEFVLYNPLIESYELELQE